LGIADWGGLGESPLNQGCCEEQRWGGFNTMSSIRKLAGKVLALWGALLTGSVLVLCGGSVQAQTPLEEFKNFLTNPPPIEEIVFERKVPKALPTPAGFQPAGSFFQLRLQTNAYFARQMQVMGEAPKNHRAGNLLEGAWDDTYWNFNGHQVYLWHSRKLAELRGEVKRSAMFETILSLGLEMRLDPSTIVWEGDAFTAQGTNWSRYEGRIESKTPAGLPERIIVWSEHDPDLYYGVDYEYRLNFHPWFPVTIKPFFGRAEHRPHEFHISSLSMGKPLVPQDRFFPKQFTNLNTITVLHTNGTTQVFSQGQRMVPSANGTLAIPTSPPPGNAPLLTNKGLSLPPALPPSNKVLIAALLCLSAPVLIVLFVTLKSKGKGG